jgi:outer membrane protein assembly factor BamB
MIFRSLAELRTTSQALTPPLELAWSVPTGGSNQWLTSPIVHRGRVYVGPENMNVGRFKPVLQCLDAATGARRWETALDACVRSSPAATDGRVYVQTNAGTAYCLDADSGAIVWRKTLYPHRCNPDDAKCAVLIDQGRLFTCGEYGPVSVLNLQTGEAIASWPTPGAADRIYYGGPFPYAARIYLSTLWGAFACELASGKTLWQTGVQELVRRGVAMGVVQDGVYYVRGYAGVAAFNAAEGTLVWSVRNNVGGGVPIPTLADGVLYVGGQRAAALDARTGKELWGYAAMRQPDESNRRQTFGGSSSPLVAGDLVYLGRDDGDLVAIDRRSGAPVWCFSVGLPVKGSPVVSGNTLFVCDFDGNLHAFAGR